jgi:hypothetical protein
MLGFTRKLKFVQVDADPPAVDPPESTSNTLTLEAVLSSETSEQTSTPHDVQAKRRPS